MAVFHLERASANGNKKKAGSTLHGWPQRLSAAIMVPLLIGLIILKPTWFEPDE
ncbi:hypothetical protein D3C80_354830 [compost metagenome]